MQTTNIPFSLVNTNKSTLEQTDVTNGCVYFVQDTKELYFDFDSKRVAIRDIEVIQNESDRTSRLFTPLNKFYFVLETSKLYLYKDGTWYTISPDLTQFITTEQIQNYALKSEIPTTAEQVGALPDTTLIPEIILRKWS